MVIGIRGNDKTNVSWIYSGSVPNDHHCTAEFTFQAEPIVEPICSDGYSGGSISFSHRPPFEHITFFAIDERTLNVYQQLALAVLSGDRDAALILADQVAENYSL